MKAIKTLWFWLTRYMVAVQWEEKQIIHWAKTEREAIEWLTMYRHDVTAMYGKRGRLIAARWM